MTSREPTITGFVLLLFPGYDSSKENFNTLYHSTLYTKGREPMALKHKLMARIYVGRQTDIYVH